MPSKAEELTGRFAHTKHYNEKPDEPFLIGELEGLVAVLGAATPDEFIPGLTYVFYGTWKEHGTYGRQFQFSSFTLQQPADETAVCTYLSRAPGIGRAISRKLWGLYGVKAVDMAKDPDKLRAEFNVPAERASACAAWLVEQERTQQTMLALTQLFAGHNLPRDLPRILITQWGAEAPKLVSENPFRLVDFPNVGFKKADAIWEALDKPKDSMIRGVHCATYAVKSANDGSTWYPRGLVYGETRGHLGTEKLEATECIEQAVEQGLLDVYVHNGEPWYAEARKAKSERDLAVRSIEVHNSLDDDIGIPDYDRLAWPDVSTIPGLTDHQREQLGVALSGPIGILTGGPGVGKTYTVAQLVKSILANGSGGLGVSAPTGKAGVRAAEALKAEGVEDVRPTTMHVKLAFNGSGFDHGRGNPLPFQFHVLDEQSMVTTDLENSYMQSVREGAHVLLVLDPHQLPPVGHGKPALDFIKWGIPCGVLSEPLRSSGRIVKCCLDIRQRKQFSSSRELDLEAGENLFMTEAGNTQRALADLEYWLDQSRQMGLNLTEDVQVIAPMNERGDLCVERMNEWLQHRLNKSDPWGDWRFKVGDKVVCTRNGKYERLDGGLGEDETYVANGEQGIVEELRDKMAAVRMPYPERLVKFTKGSPIELAWCITCHKSQGSEWPVTIVMFDPAYSRGGTAEWVTTAVSRAKLFCIGVGKKSTAQKWVRRTGLFKRKTFLREQMTEFNNFQWSEQRDRREKGG